MTEPSQSSTPIDLAKENARLRATIEGLQARLQNERRISGANIEELEKHRVANRALRRQSEQLRSELSDLPLGGGDIDDGLFIYRDTPSSFARLLIVPLEMKQAVVQESGDWDSGPSNDASSWFGRLRSAELPLADERCLRTNAACAISSFDKCRQFGHA
ncbi:hypothetical protein CLAFUW4_04540 [Fulvia fulva]|uniref:Uncharacterized protein n=1 Tax=Passalora fulva TaxID=5499 RepID=A0A9Q8LEK3_PASFU|nr:uncharacterized protein CLAFUR5_04503 [Fulvia fulva]KAK4626403.1 hypothetical protein CLAFUR4_04526 [Fulvia fulva]KAK4628131.1 hypothetical protein CLAFUR0_04529 [Fulvia fulva]UJO16012.1 hypothetical protein CLAFUR5_04503 [Fulvia fulva]WPV13117.1 hypothetical protein CLAFUW4_04540 [Fulvia fulva]WPV28046.1 hypothetical protein CLAFUW7_04532 [Fulvia fulva]